MSKANGSVWKKILITVNVLLLIGLSGASIYLYLDNKNLSKDLSLSEDERKTKLNQDIKDKVSKLMSLPNEEPTFIIVNDAEVAVKENPGLVNIFENLEKGDYLLIFRKDGSGVQYRPSENKIIKSTSIAFPIAIELVGSETAIADVEKKLVSFGNQITLTKTIKDGLTQSFIVDVDNDQSAETKSIADLLKFEIGSTLPVSITPGEQTEIVIVVASGNTNQTTPVEP